MKTILTPYINFKNGEAKDAMEFYKGIFGGKLEMTTFADAHMDDVAENEKENVMHAMLEAENGVTFMASDVPSHMEFQVGDTIKMSLSGDNEEELRGYWAGLSEGATIFAPLEPAPWGDTFGMLIDKFGINWMVNISGKKESE